MFHIRPYIVIIFLSGSLSAFSQSPDYTIRDFHENALDLTAATATITDLRGLKPALIRFAVRDTLFSFTANNGIMNIKKDVGEILLFVPDGTKRITIRHPYLGILRDYELPIPITTRRTYDAEIVITNVDYLRKIFGYEQSPTVNDVPETHDDIFVEVPLVEEPLPKKPPKVKTPRTPIQTRFLIGAGFNALSVMGPSATIGLEIGKFYIGADYVYGMEKVEGVGVYYKQSSKTTLNEAYDYTDSRASLKIGVNFSPNSPVQVIPQVGASINMIMGKELKKGNKSEPQFDKCNSLSAFAALSLRVKLGKTFCLQITPQYNMPVGKNEVYEVLKDADKKIKAWGEGFGLNAGFILRF